MLRSLCHELVKLRIQKKNYVMLGGHLLFLGLCYLAFRSAQGNFFRRFDKTMNFHVEDLTSYLDGLFFARIGDGADLHRPHADRGRHARG